MAVVPFRWQGRSRREKVRAGVESCLEAWLAQWACGEGFGIEVRLCAPGHVEHGSNATARWVIAHAVGGSSVHLFSTGDLEARLGGQLAGVDPGDAAGLAAGIGKRALADLFKQMLGAGATYDWLPEGEGPAASGMEPRCGVVGLECRLDEVDLHLYLDLASCDRIAPAGIPDAGGLERRDVAVLSCDVALQAVLDLGRVALADVSDLAPGEIIKTDVRLDAVVAAMSGARTVFSGALVALEGRRALRCVSTGINGGM